MNKYLGQNVVRVDGRVKATGSLKYMTDLKFDNSLVAKLVRSPHAHAKILSIDIRDALKVDGVVDILTHLDIPGLNGFGIEGTDQPVFCSDKVRYIGDPIALVIGENEQSAAKALEKIKVSYDVLKPIFKPEDALLSDAENIHEKGNMVRKHFYSYGDVDAAFEKAAVVIKNTYTTPYQEHAYIETEGGWGVPREDGGVIIYAPAQYGYRNLKQLCAILDMNPEQITVASSPIGGGFGGKDDMMLDPFLALAALKTGRPVKMHLSREESFLVSVKRLPFKITMKTAADKEGKLIAHKVHAISEAGPFTGISGAVFNYAFENACCVYKIPNIELGGHCVFTNNSITGAFRGFGNNQITFATERQMDAIAKQLNMDPIELRMKNSIRKGDTHSYGHKISNSVNVDKCLQGVAQSAIWKNRQTFKKDTIKPWIRRGVGMAVCQHGNGLGNALPDDSTVTVRISDDGKIILVVSNEEMGQGILTSLTIIAADTLGVDMENIHIICGNTTLAPDSGPTTASRATLMTGNSVVKAISNLKHNLYKLADSIWHTECKIDNEGIYNDTNRLTWCEVATLLSEKGECEVTATTSFPVSDLKMDLGLHYVHTYVSQVVGVEVNTLTGEVAVIETEIFPNAGPVINKLGYEGQSEGGTVMGMGFTIMEGFKNVDGIVKTRNLQTYLVPTAADIPKIKVTPIEDKENNGPYGAKGLGEPVMIPSTPAIVSAVEDAIGVRINELPLSPEKVYRALQLNN